MTWERREVEDKIKAELRDLTEELRKARHELLHTIHDEHCDRRLTRADHHLRKHAVPKLPRPTKE